MTIMSSKTKDNSVVIEVNRSFATDFSGNRFGSLIVTIRPRSLVHRS